MTGNVTNELLFETLKAIQEELTASLVRDEEILRRLENLEAMLTRMFRYQPATRPL